MVGGSSLREEFNTNMAEDDEEVCIGTLCFVKPYERYVPPAYYPRISRREYRWKMGAQVNASPEVQCKISHAVAVPNILGLGPEARWWWQWIPISLMTSIATHFQLLQQQRSSSEDSQRDGISNLRKFRVGFSPRARLKVSTPVFGKLAIQPMVELLPTRTLMLRRQFHVGTSKLTLQANLEIDDMVGLKKWPQWSFRVSWHPADTVKFLLQPGKEVIEVQYSRSSPECKLVAAGLAEVPANYNNDGASRILGSLPLRARLDSCKVSYIITDKAPRSAPLTTSAYLKASEKIGTSDFISIIPGHWVDPGFETGAPGERDFNMDVANMLEKKLMANGWKVLRPDRDSPNLTWEEYLNWVSKKASQGIPVLEIHGQGSKADHRGLVLGVIGDSNASLNKELGKDFGYFRMNWRDLGVPRRGGAILESFNSDEVLEMAPWQRKWSARRIASRIVTCIERAGHENRASRGVIIDADSDDEILALDSAS